MESSWQEDVTEKSLNEMLDQLIQETALTFSKENENNSRIFYIQPDNLSRRSQDSTHIYSKDNENMENLVNHLENSKTSYPRQNGGEITVQIERTSGLYQAIGDSQDMEIINAISNSETPFEEQDNNVAVLSSDLKSNLIHKYPEIIIDTITSDVTEIGNKLGIEETLAVSHKSNPNHLKDEKKKEVAAKALDSLVKIVMNEAPTRKSFDVAKAKDLDDVKNFGRTTHIHNAYHNHVINNVTPYTGILSRGKMALGKLPEGYRDLHRIINRPMRAYLDSNLQLNRWGGNTGQNPLMSISRAYNRNRVQFIPESFPRILPRIIYQPVFQRKYHG